ncbi:MAG: sulfite exporter TauE/SafE family protein [Tissierellia bacterium]|nr:sulfite exporter TauE/SafE family protein [Tissierellia bacterium]
MDRQTIKLMAIGLVTGTVNGLFGSGGGTLVVPALVFLIGIEDYKAHATAISIILPLSVISAFIYLKGRAIPLNMGIIIVAGGVIGSFIGAKFLKKIPNNILRKVFGSVIVFTALRMIFR